MEDGRKRIDGLAKSPDLTSRALRLLVILSNAKDLVFRLRVNSVPMEDRVPDKDLRG